MFILNNMKTTTKINQKSRERERETETETETERQRERHTQRDRQRERERELLCAASNYLIKFVIRWQNGRTG